MKPKLNEEKRQLLRKENEKSSRLLDNYYNPNINKKIWEPAGSIKSKTNYVYGDSGLSYNIIDSSLSKENCSTALLSFSPPIANKVLSGDGDKSSPPYLWQELNVIIFAIKFFSCE